MTQATAWCYYFGPAGAIGDRATGISRLTNAQIVGFVREHGAIEFDALIEKMELSGSPTEECKLRLERMLARELLVAEENMVRVPEVEEKPAAKMGRPVEHSLDDFLPAMRQHAPTAAHALPYTKLLALCQDIQPVGKSAFRRILDEGLAQEKIFETDERKFYAPAAEEVEEP